MEGIHMLQTIEVEIDAGGHVHPLEPRVSVPAGRALLTPLPTAAEETALLAEGVLARDWLKPEEDAAWATLQPDR
jgi:hypothetical protein